MKRLIKLTIVSMTLMMSVNAFSKKLILLPKKDCKVLASKQIEVKNSTRHHWVPGTQIKFKTNAPEKSVYGVSSTIVPGGVLLIPISKSATKCRAAAVLK